MYGKWYQETMVFILVQDSVLFSFDHHGLIYIQCNYMHLKLFQLKGYKENTHRCELGDIAHRLLHLRKKSRDFLKFADPGNKWLKKGQSFIKISLQIHSRLNREETWRVHSRQHAQRAPNGAPWWRPQTIFLWNVEMLFEFCQMCKRNEWYILPIKMPT